MKPFKYNIEDNTISPLPEMAEPNISFHNHSVVEAYYNHIASLPTYPVSKDMSKIWSGREDLIEGKDFEIKDMLDFAWHKPYAVPLQEQSITEGRASVYAFEKYEDLTNAILYGANNFLVKDGWTNLLSQIDDVIIKLENKASQSIQKDNSNVGNEWISVNEDLPDLKGMTSNLIVLGFFPLNNMAGIVVFDGENFKNNNPHMFGEITHWMPLPQPLNQTPSVDKRDRDREEYKLWKEAAKKFVEDSFF